MRIGRVLLAAGAAVMLVQGCEEEATTPTGEVSSNETAPAAPLAPVDQEPRERVVVEPQTAPGERRPAVMGTTEMAFPTGEPESSLIQIAAVGEPEVRLGEMYIYQISVRNLSDNITLDNVMVRQELPESFSIDQSEPQHQMQDRDAVWQVGMLSPGATRTIRVAGVPQEEGAVNACVRVSYNPALCTTFMVVKPELQIEKQAPQSVSICEPIPIRYIVRNPGTAATEAVTIMDSLPEGLTTEDGKREVQLTLERIEPGQAAEVTVNARAQRAGEFSSRAVASTQAGLEVRSSTTTTVVSQPKLDVRVNGPQLEYIGSAMNYTIAVANTGDGPTLPGRLLLTIDPDTQVLAPATLEVEGGTVALPLEAMAPGQSRNYMLTLSKATPGELTVVAKADTPCAQQPEPAQVVTQVHAVSALLLEVVDREDPVREGGDQVYDIVVVNQGSAPDTNVKIVATLPPGFEFIDASGSTEAQSQGNKVTFQPVGSLAPGQEARWAIRARAQGQQGQGGQAPPVPGPQGQQGQRQGPTPGVADLRFQVEMTSDSLQQPVRETESTKLLPS